MLIERDGEWKIRRIQGTMIPVENAFVAGIAREAAKWTGIVAGIAGLLVGFVVGAFWKRSRSRPAA